MKNDWYWSQKTNPETGYKFEKFADFLRIARNEDGDIDAFIASEYGDKFAELLQLRFLYEEDPMGEACLSFFRSIGVIKEMHEAEDYYTRWAIYIPDNMAERAEAGKKFPLVLYNHGGGCAIECDEFPHQLPLMVKKEQFILVMAQDTSYQNTERLITLVSEKWPVDTERVYLCGYSQGGQATEASLFRIPEKLTAAGPCGSFVFRTWDNQDVPFTLDEAEKLRKIFVPVIQISGACEASNYGKVNSWRPRMDWGWHIRCDEAYSDPNRDEMRDPTRNNGKMSTLPYPPKCFTDYGEWMLGRLNMRLDMLNCEPRDVERCKSYVDAPINTPIDKLHHELGFYGDREYTSKYYGYEHYTIDILNRAGINAYRFISVENCPHWPMVMMGPLLWSFFKQFRRDSKTGEIVVDEYMTY
ncbi:MAG: hypothetical protein ACI3VB_08935 [Oscillospiraceae bacterium]